MTLPDYMLLHRYGHVGVRDCGVRLQSRGAMSEHEEMPSGEREKVAEYQSACRK